MAPTSKSNAKVKPAEGKLGILMPGLGAVATTMIAGVEAIKQDIAKPIGSLAWMGKMRLGKRNENRMENIRDVVSFSRPDQVVFGGWDIFKDNAYESALNA
ncbi:MAG TPA: inositol-3-phosphate synthase, partial [Oligoflexia bacterium]|nr:inositol-3-phosphate synthase [Oligoflexia bacterium]